MQVNATPFNDTSVNLTGCCPRFNAAGWDGAELTFADKPFVRAHTMSVAHVPLNMGGVFTRAWGHIEAAGASDPAQAITLSRDLSAWTAEHLFAVTRDVPEEEMTTLSGRFLTRVFDGPFSEAKHWHEEMQALARAQGHTPGPVWFYYTTCPKCAQVYGHNPVVGLVQVG